MGASARVGVVKHTPAALAFQTRLLSSAKTDVFTPTDQFLHRHMGSVGDKKRQMLEAVGFNSLEELVDSAVPTNIRRPKRLQMDPPMSESEALGRMKAIMSKNKVLKSFIGVGYYETLLPHPILRNVSTNVEISIEEHSNTHAYCSMLQYCLYLLRTDTVRGSYHCCCLCMLICLYGLNACVHIFTHRCLRTPGGTLRTPLTKQRSPRVGSNRFSTIRPWSPT